jgi:hypothetical protein
MTCVPGLDFQGPFGDGVTLGHVLVFVSLEVIAVLNFMYIDVHKPMFPQAMKISTTFYAFVTGFFALARLVFQVGRPLLIGAALHNLSEWSFLIQITASDEATQKTRLLMATAWIIFVVNFVVMMPTLGLAVLGEQSTGIVLDFALPLAYASLYFSGEPTRKFYRLPLVAHTIHLLFTILPLVFANFHVGQISWYSRSSWRLPSTFLLRSRTSCTGTGAWNSTTGKTQRRRTMPVRRARHYRRPSAWNPARQSAS